MKMKMKTKKKKKDLLELYTDVMRECIGKSFDGGVDGCAQCSFETWPGVCRSLMDVLMPGIAVEHKAIVSINAWRTCRVFW